MLHFNAIKTFTFTFAFFYFNPHRIMAQNLGFMAELQRLNELGHGGIERVTVQAARKLEQLEKLPGMGRAIELKLKREIESRYW
jgi:hypothetical protein